MKTRKLSAVLLLFIAIAFITKVNAQKPTKEQTIKWITETIEMYYGDGNITDLKVTPCQITYKNGSNKIIAPVDADLVVSFDESENYLRVNYRDMKPLKMIIRSDGDKDFRGSFIPLTANSPEIGERMIKAVKHLATFCTKEESPF